MQEYPPFPATAASGLLPFPSRAHPRSFLRWASLPLSPGGCGPARCSWCDGREPSRAEGVSGPRFSVEAWTETPPADSAHRAEFWVDSTFGNAPQSREGRDTSAPGPLRLTPFSPTTTSFSALWPDCRVARSGCLRPPQIGVWLQKRPSMSVILHLINM